MRFLLAFFFCLICVKESRGVAINNGLLDEPVITCAADSITAVFRTQRRFDGNVYVKGYFGQSACHTEATGTREAGINLPFHSPCGLRRNRRARPPGLTVSAAVVIMFHPRFLTKIDRAFRVECFYMEAQKTVTSQVEISMLPTVSLTQNIPMPVCTYEVLRGSSNGPPVRYAQIGDAVYHKWACEGESAGLFCMTVHTCTVDDGQGSSTLLLDQQGYAQIGDAVYHKWACEGESAGLFCMTVHTCTVDDGQGSSTLLLDQQGYAQIGDAVYHKWACEGESAGLFCMTVHTCTVDDGQGSSTLLLDQQGYAQIGDAVYHKWACEGESAGLFCMTVHTCTVDDGQGSSTLLLDQQGYAQIGDAVYHKWACEGESAGLFCMTVHTCTVDDGQGSSTLLLDQQGCSVDQYLLLNLDYLGDTVAGQEAHVFKFADKPTLFFNCQIRLTVKEGNACTRSARFCSTIIRGKRSLTKKSTSDDSPYSTTIDVTSNQVDVVDIQEIVPLRKKKSEMSNLIDLESDEKHSVCLSVVGLSILVVVIITLMFCCAVLGTLIVLVRRRANNTLKTTSPAPSCDFAKSVKSQQTSVAS